MKVVFLDTPKDVQWLFETHLKGVTKPEWARSFMLYGNEDAPMEICLYDRKNPRVSGLPRWRVRWEGHEETGNLAMLIG
jgi:hypothetical protein